MTQISIYTYVHGLVTAMILLPIVYVSYLAAKRVWFGHWRDVAAVSVFIITFQGLTDLLDFIVDTLIGVAP